MARRSPSYVLGYHGCDKATARRILEDGEEFIHSEKDYDWLGPGAYFWENDPERAFEWAEQRVADQKAADAYVVGAVLDLGNCLDLTLRENLEWLRLGYADLEGSFRNDTAQMPANRDVRGHHGVPDKLLRFRDCAVIRRIHSLVELDPEQPKFDSVRGMFLEGAEVYDGAGFNQLTHTQIAVLTQDCVIEVFTPKALRDRIRLDA